MNHQFQQTNCLLCGSSESETVYTTTTQMMINDGAEFHYECCNDCGLIYLNPRIAEQELGAYYPSYYLPYRGGKAWGRFATLVNRAQKKIDRKRVRIARNCLPQKDSRVLDVGCGNPSFLRQLVKQGYHGTGIDFKAEGWDDETPENDRLQLFEVDPKEFHSEKPYDLITMWHYLEHDYNPAKTLQHLREMAHADTRLVIEVPDYDSISRKRFGEKWEGFHAPRHTAVYTATTLKSMLNKNGWEVVDAKKFGTLNPYSLWWMSKMEARELDWSKSMEPHFWGYMAGMIRTAPLFALKRWIRTGVQLVTARPQKK